MRQLSLEQIETYAKQVTAAEKLRALNEAQATAAMQTKLTNSLVQVQIVENEAEAQLAKARKEAEQKVVTAQAESQQRILAGRGEGAQDPPGGSVRGVGPGPQDPVVLRPAAVRPVDRRPEPGPEQPAAGPRARLHRRRRRQQRPLGRRPAVGAGATAGTGLLGMLLSLLVAEKSGFDVAGLPGGNVLQEFADKISKQAMENIQEAMAANVGSATNGNVNLNLEVTDPSKPVASRPRPQPVEATTTTASKS